MLKRILAGSILIALASQAMAGKAINDWVSYETKYGEWLIASATPDSPKGIYGCSNWSPKVVSLPTKVAAPGAVVVSSTKIISQNATDCKIDQFRVVQLQKRNRTTREIRPDGPTFTEKMTLVNQYSSRDYKVEITPWTAASKTYGCLSWTPPVDYISAGKTFTQTATGCKLDQARTRTESIVSSNIKNFKPMIVKSVIEKQTLGQQTETRIAVGTKKVQ